jgi:hypothetical protein
LVGRSGFLISGISGVCDRSAEFLTERAGEVARKVAHGLAWFVFSAVDALTDATTFKTGMFVNAGALKLMVLRLVSGAADAAGDE